MSTENKVEVIALTLPQPARQGEWTRLTGIYPEDDIWFRQEPVMPRQIYLSLEAAPLVTWWKGAEIVKIAGDQVISGAYTQDGDPQLRPAFHAISNFERFADYRVWLSKAKFMGWHTRMYWFNAEDLFGKHTIFQWRRDG